MRRTILLAALLIPAAPVAAAPLDPAAFGDLFCSAGLADDMGPVEALFAPDLAPVVAEALARNEAMQAAHPDEKPPLGDGLPWRSWTDSASDCSVDAVAIEGNEARVTIGYSFADAPAADYADTLILVDLGGGDWRFADVELVDGARFRDIVETAFDQ